MRELNIFLALLLCLAIPLQSFARVLESGAPCQMEHCMAMPTADTDRAMDCRDPAAPTCKHCQAGEHCSCASQLFQASMPCTFLPISSKSSRLARSILFPTSFVPAGLWRPPARF
ncbi:MAG: hypothetical protein Q8M09_11065 [Pseudomonadota bacterium]|nr:hypothetical protein [Pseudomonadota bacterium]MDP2352637.1 hypothetical protein [Pseudomonadota bacterium]